MHLHIFYVDIPHLVDKSQFYHSKLTPAYYIQDEA